MAQFSFPGQTGFYRGKVRDVYSIGSKWLLMIASDRISAFDVILPRPIPFKGQVLNQLAAFMLKATADICPNWLLETPAPQASIGLRCQPFKVEIVVRGNLTGHAWRTYASGKRVLCGVTMPDGMRENDFFPEPIITPTTKAEQGHDEDISREDIISKGLLSAKQWEIISTYALSLFKRGQDIAAAQNLILADTKYEFGEIEGVIHLMDEIHTPDSSRYFEAEGFEERLSKGEKQKQLSKEFVREWLMANGFMGREGEQVPEMSDEWIGEISRRYIELFEKVTGHRFVPEPINEDKLYGLICDSLSKLT